MKVLHVLNTGEYSGAENVVITLIDSYKDEVQGIYCGKKGPIEDVLEVHDIPFASVPKLNIKNMKRVLRETVPDIIHAHDFTAGIICAMTGTKIPIINHIHNNPLWIKRYNIRSIAYVISSLRYKKILTVSPSVMDEYVFGKWLKKKTVIVGNPIDTKKIIALAGHDNTKTYDIAFLGRLTTQKNPFLFLEIVKGVKEKIQDLKVIMIGDGELRKNIIELIQEHNLEDTITLVGFQKNPYMYLKRAKVLLMSSSWEGYGLAAVEALTLGLPVVCSEVGGLPTIVNNECGMLCGAEHEYIDELIQLIKDKKYYETKARKAIVRANELDNLEEYKQRMLNIYYAVLVGEV